MVNWCESVGPSHKVDMSVLGDVRWVTLKNSHGMHSPLNDEEDWRSKSWNRKSTRIGLFGIVVICLLLSAVVALAILLFESGGGPVTKEPTTIERVYIPVPDLLQDPKFKQDQKSSEGDLQASGRAASTLDNINSKPKQDSTSTSTSTSTSKNPDVKEGSSKSSEATQTSSELPESTSKQLQAEEEKKPASDSAVSMNASSNETVVARVITVFRIEVDTGYNDDEDDESSEEDDDYLAALTNSENDYLDDDSDYDDDDDNFKSFFPESSAHEPWLEKESEEEGVANTEDPLFVEKSSWGGRSPLSSNTQTVPVPYVVVTQTNTRSCYDQKTCSETVRFLQSYYMDEQQLPDMGDNFYIGGDGKVYVGRGWNATNYHVGFVRFNNTGVSFIGDFNEDSPTLAQLKAFEQLIAYGLSHNILDQYYKIIAHREIEIPASLEMGPGEYLMEEINSMPHRCNIDCIANMNGFSGDPGLFFLKLRV